MLLAFLVLLPLNTNESKFSDLKAEILDSPITHLILSMILLLPHPFGPIMPVIPSSKLTMVLSAKLLNPLISNDFSLTFFELLYVCEHMKKDVRFQVKKGQFMPKMKNLLSLFYQFSPFCGQSAGWELIYHHKIVGSHQNCRSIFLGYLHQ